MHAKYRAITRRGRIFLVLIRVGKLESLQEGVDIDVGPFLGQLGLVPRVESVVRVGGVQLEDQFIHGGWSPELKIRVAELEAAQAKTQRNSSNSNSSKPPSSDIVNPPKKHQKPGRRKKRKQGGQLGQDRHLRKPFAENELD